MDTTNPQTSSSTIKTVIFCITFLALIFASFGAFLLYKGYQSGELLVGGSLTAAGTLGAMLSSTKTTPSNGKDATVTTVTATTSEPNK